MPSRRPDTAEQRLWLGPRGHRGSCGHAITNAEPESYPNSNSFGNSMRTDGYAIGNSYRDGHCHCHSHNFGNT